MARYAMNGTRIPGKRRPKYGNKKATCDGITFHSIKEKKRYWDLKMLSLAGEISGLELQPMYRMEHNGVLICHYSADFKYIKGGKEIVEDVKSEATAANKEYRLKKKMMLAFHDIEILET